MPSLLGREGPAAGRRIEVAGEVVVGRERVDVLLHDPRVSRRHARLRERADGLEIEDLGSANGTWVNDQRIQGTHRLSPGDRVRVGDSVFEVEGQAPAAVPEPAAAPPVLVAVQGPVTGRRIEVAGEVVVGREGVDVVVDDPEVSRRHARLRASDEGIEVEDLGSTNGTWVNEQRIEAAARLGPSDVLRVGDTVLALEGTGPGVPAEVTAPVPPSGPAEVTAPVAPREAPAGSGEFRAPAHPIRRRAPSTRSLGPLVATFVVIVGTAVALLLYFALRDPVA
jgi:pSer/pThr/pTyr-binding forkhead associated (FHA) protein